MKKIYLLLAIVGFTLASCNQFDKYTQKDLDFSTEFTIPAGLEAEQDYAITSEKIEPKLDGELKQYKSGVDLIESLNLKEANLEILDGDKTFGFLKEIKMYIIADGKDKIEIASKEMTKEATQKLSLEVNEKVDLTEYLKSEFIEIEISGVTNEALEEELKVKADLVYHVDFKILGQ